LGSLFWHHLAIAASASATSQAKAFRGVTMTAEEREKMNEICQRIQTEKNPEIFDQLVRELNDLIEVKHERIHPEHKGKS
jgi:hypothetical protein